MIRLWRLLISAIASENGLVLPVEISSMTDGTRVKHMHLQK
ncbi:thiosulfate oxidation carrier protein SoxY [Dorea formicigenerans]|nr:thiosulfate oxidation carrier protein SoxY [Dorea formicigenerans]